MIYFDMTVLLSLNFYVYNFAPESTPESESKKPQRVGVGVFKENLGLRNPVYGNVR